MKNSKSMILENMD